MLVWYRSQMFSKPHKVYIDSTQPRPRFAAPSFVYLAMALSFGALVFEGYDVVVYGAAVPALLAYKPWAMTTTQVGTIGSATLLGMFFGAPAAGWLSDRWGRRRVFISLLAFFSCMMLCATVAPSPYWFGLFRFLAGIGFGGIPPTTVALVNEAAPFNRKVLFAGGVLTGFGCGGILASVVSTPLLAAAGFRGLFALGAVPLVTLIPLALWLLPESGAFQTVYSHALVAGYPRTDHLDDKASRLTRLTILFTVINTFSLLVGAGLLTWFPQLMHSHGVTMADALRSLLPLNVGTIAGALFAVWLANRSGGRGVIVSMFALGALSLASLARQDTRALTNLLLFLAGAAIGGVQCVLPSFMATMYPSDRRATAVGIASGFGRLGGVAGPLLAGVLLSAKVTYTGIIFVFVAAEVIAGGFALRLPRSVRSADSKFGEASDGAKADGTCS